MKKTFRLRFVALALGLMLVPLFANPAQAANRADIARRIEEYRQFFIDFQSAPDSCIPGDLLADCYGVIIVRQYKAGFGIGIKGGEGIILMHDRATDDWYGPAFVRTADGSFGFQIGGQAIDAIILIMNQAGVDMLVKTRFTIGLDAAAAAGPVGRDFGASVGPGTALLTYSRSRGLFAGAAFEGGAMFNYDRYNYLLYGMPVGLRDILLDRIVPVPVEAGPIIETLKSYETRRPAAGPPAFYYQPGEEPGAVGIPPAGDVGANGAGIYDGGTGSYDGRTGSYGGGAAGYDAGAGNYQVENLPPGGSKYDAFAPEPPVSDLDATGPDQAAPGEYGDSYGTADLLDPEDPYSPGGAFGGSKYDAFTGAGADGAASGADMSPTTTASPGFPPPAMDSQLLDQQQFNQQAANQSELDRVAREAAAEAERAVQAANAARAAAAAAEAAAEAARGAVY